MCLRYEMEYSSPLMLLAVVGLLALERALAGQPARRRAARCGWGLLLAFSVAFNLLAGVGAKGANHANYAIALMHLGRTDEGIAQYQKVLRVIPDDPLSTINIGQALLMKGKVDDVIAQFQKVLQLHPDSALAHNTLGNALVQKGRIDEGIVQYQQALQLNPRYPEARFNLGIALLQKGGADEAIAQFQQALQLKPDYPEACGNLGYALLQKGRVDEAIGVLQKALEMKPGNADARQMLANALLQTGRWGEAISQYQSALQLKPSDPSIQHRLAWLLATCPDASLRNGGKALELARQASLLTGGEDPMVLQTLAAAYAEAGMFSEAVETAQRALRLAEAQSNTALAATLEQEVKLYQAGTPLRGPELPH
jgi:Flp pilus assembly protein TadD